MSSGVCFHHRDGEDWHRQCDQWERMSKKNHNCRSQEPIAELVRRRVSHLPNAWIFYVGDHEIPTDLEALGLPVIARGQMTSSNAELTVTSADQLIKSMPRDLGAFLDYFLCSQMPAFIGNSVSSWSASQIALRDTAASWYNSFDIPLAQYLKSFIVPFVYTYAEESSAKGKLLLQVSILSVKKQMPAASIHMLYHGEGAADFRGWLIQHGVVIHDHQPKWRGKLEEMRRAVLKHRKHPSRLYDSPGNFFSTFQRIDIPRFLSVEYCILLDSDAFVVRPFTIADLGAEMPQGLAFSSEMDEEGDKPVNAGVALLNVPFLRESLDEFHEFVFNHTEHDFVNGPGDQGAFLDFYDKDIKFLSPRFNMKPYYNNKANWKHKYIVQYHGLKPHEQIAYWFDGTCEPLQCSLISRFSDSPYKCEAMVEFAKAAAFEGPGVIREYCYISLASHGDLCVGLLNMMAHRETPPGTSCVEYFRAALLQGRRLSPGGFIHMQ